MEIKDILDKLGLDLSSAEARRGAIEAIDAILASRNTAGTGGGSMGGGEMEIELDPDLLQPSIKQSQTDSDDDDVEIEDEDDILSQIKHKDSEDPIENTNSEGSDDKSSEDSNNSQETNNSDDTSNDTKDNDQKPNNDKDTSNKSQPKDDIDNSSEDEEDELENEDDEDAIDTEDADSDISDGFDSGDDTDYADDFSDFDDENGNIDDLDDANTDDLADGSDDLLDSDDSDTDAASDKDNEDDQDVEDTDEEDDFDFDETDLVDDDLVDITKDKDEMSKLDSRKMKRERTLKAAKKTLADARSRNVDQSLIQELEKAIEALEIIQEAVSNNLADLSDKEFNRLINRVLDAIDACGNSGLTYTSQEEREARVQEIKKDLSQDSTQHELSAEDTAKIRAETQALKAREKEMAKYQQRSASSFSGFQAFLDSLTQAVKRQTSNARARADSWNSINKKYAGTGILRPGKVVKELPNTKIPVIDFYFDCSSSWKQHDIAIGKKAMAALAELEAEGKIKVNPFYFSDWVSTEYNDVAGGCTAGWNHIVKNVIATRATNVVIMTDSDMEAQGEGEAGVSGFLKYTVPGYVWYLWKNGKNAQRLPRDLTGRKGVQQFSFSASDL